MGPTKREKTMIVSKEKIQAEAERIRTSYPNEFEPIEVCVLVGMNLGVDAEQVAEVLGVFA